MHNVEEGKWAHEEEPGLAHHAMWQAQEQAGHAEDEVNVCISEVHIPLHVEHITLHHELGLCMGMGKPMGFASWVPWLQVRCQICQPVETL